MKTGTDIIDRIYFFLDGAGVPSLINGGMYIGNYNPENAPDDEFIVINTVSFNEAGVVNESYANINLFISDKNGYTDFSRFRSLSPAIQVLINSYNDFKAEMVQKIRDVNGTVSDVATDLTQEFFSLKIKFAPGPFKDEKVFKNHSILNIRVQCYIEK